MGLGITSVLVEQVSAVNWSIGIKPVKAAAHLEVKVTVGTNTPEEKARFVAEAMALLRSVLGPDLSPVTYVVIHDVPGEAWGYDGRTQADRALAAKAG